MRFLGGYFSAPRRAVHRAPALRGRWGTLWRNRGACRDMLSLGRAMLARGEIGSQAILRPETPDGTPLPIGLGWHLGCTGSEHYAYRLGGGGGFRSELSNYPRLNYAVAVIGNETSFDTGAFHKPSGSLECVRKKCERFFRQDARQNKNLEPAFDSIKSG